MLSAILFSLAILIPGRIPSSRLLKARDGPPPEQPTDNPLDTAADLELFAACVDAGLSPTHAAAAVASTSTCPGWRSTASLLALGIDADKAWHDLAQYPGLEELAALACNSHRSGAALSKGCSRIAARLRDDGADYATAAAERAGVLIALPMTLCYLPAFFLLGLAPVVIGLGTTILRIPS